MRSRWFILVYLVLSVAPLYGQTGDIRGVVVDSVTGEKIPYASVMILNTSRGVSSNLSGFFLIAGLPSGSYELAVSSVGYVRHVRRCFVRPGDVLNLTVSLPPEAVQMGEVVVTQRAIPEAKEIQTSVQVLDQRELKLVPVTVQEDVFRSIAVLPGIVSTSDVSAQFYVRGGASDQNLILLDGMRIYNPYHALGIFSIFDSDAIQTTEVYTGAFPPGYGGRLSSVVSLTTRDGRTSSLAVRANLNLLSAKVQVEGPAGENVRFFMNGRKSLSHTTFDRFLQQDAPLDFYDFFGKATFLGSGGQTRYSLQTFQSGDQLVFADPAAPRYRWRNSAVGVVGSGLLDDRLYVFALASGSNFEGSREVPAGSSERPATSLVSDFTARMNATLYTDTRTLYFFGFEFNFPTLRYTLVNNLNTPVTLSSTLAEIGAWVRSQMTFDRFQFDGGVHLDLAELFRGSTPLWFQPRVNMSYALFDDWRIKASAGRFSQHLVTVNNEDDLITLFDAWIAVPDHLEAERSDHLVVGVGGSVAAQWGLDLQAYHKTFRSLVTYNAGKLVASDPDYISGSGNASGVEVSLRFVHPDVDLLGAYGLGTTSLSQPGISYPPRYDRRHSVKLLTVFHVATSLDLSARWDYGSGLPFTPSRSSYNRPTYSDFLQNPTAPELGDRYLALGPKNSFRLPDYHRLDLAATYRQRIGPILAGVGVSVTNAYDRKNVFYYDRRNARRVNSLSFFPSASLTLEYP